MNAREGIKTIARRLARLPMRGGHCTGCGRWERGEHLTGCACHEGRRCGACYGASDAHRSPAEAGRCALCGMRLARGGESVLVADSRTGKRAFRRASAGECVVCRGDEERAEFVLQVTARGATRDGGFVEREEALAQLAVRPAAQAALARYYRTAERKHAEEVHEELQSGGFVGRNAMVQVMAEAEGRLEAAGDAEAAALARAFAEPLRGSREARAAFRRPRDVRPATARTLAATLADIADAHAADAMRADALADIADAHATDAMRADLTDAAWADWAAAVEASASARIRGYSARVAAMSFLAFADELDGASEVE